MLLPPRRLTPIKAIALTMYGASVRFRSDCSKSCMFWLRFTWGFAVCCASAAMARRGRPRGDGWTQCDVHREAIRRWLGEGLRLTKICKLLGRQGVALGI